MADDLQRLAERVEILERELTAHRLLLFKVAERTFRKSTLNVMAREILEDLESL